MDAGTNADKLYVVIWENTSLMDERQSRVVGLASRFEPCYHSKQGVSMYRGGNGDYRGGSGYRCGVGKGSVINSKCC